MIPDNMRSNFDNIISNANRKKKSKFYESKEERLERIKQQLGIKNHGKGKRKKRNKKKGGSK